MDENQQMSAIGNAEARPDLVAPYPSELPHQASGLSVWLLGFAFFGLAYHITPESLAEHARLAAASDRTGRCES